MKTIIILMSVMLVGCSATSPSAVESTDSLKATVQELSAKANAGDQKYFEALLDESYKTKAAGLIEMIKRSEIEQNYKQRFTERPDGTGRLDYHYLEKGCHFQVDLKKTDEQWKVTRIWFCR